MGRGLRGTLVSGSATRAPVQVLVRRHEWEFKPATSWSSHFILYILVGLPTSP